MNLVDIDNYNQETKEYGFYVYGTDDHGNLEPSYGGENYRKDKFDGYEVSVGKWYYQYKGTLTEDNNIR